MYGMLLLQMHYIVSASLVWEMGDEGWSYMYWGITDRATRPKQAMASLRSVVSHIGAGNSVVRDILFFFLNDVCQIANLPKLYVMVKCICKCIFFYFYE